MTYYIRTMLNKIHVWRMVIAKTEDEARKRAGELGLEFDKITTNLSEAKASSALNNTNRRKVQHD